MEQSPAASPWLLIFCLAVAATGGVLQARAQLDSKGFVSVDCGLPGKASYVDGGTKLSYVSDAGFIDDTAGANHNISAEYIRPQLSRRYHDVRSFPDGTRNCYTLRSLVSGRKYLVRAAFLYGDYDGLGRPPIFDLHLGVNYWQTVNVSTPGFELTAEAIMVVPDDFVQVCLVNTGAGTPFVSALELRPLKMKFYPQANLTQGLVLDVRLNLGPADVTDIVRYPEDPHDRVWIPWADPKEWREISTTKQVDSEYDDFELLHLRKEEGSCRDASRAPRSRGPSSRPHGGNGGHRRPSGGAEGGRRAALAPAAVHGGRRGGVRGGERRPQPRPPGRRLRARGGRVPARPRGARHARRLPLPRPHRIPLPWSRVREPVAQVRGAGVRRRRGGRAGAGAPYQGHRRKAHRQVRHQVLHGR